MTPRRKKVLDEEREFLVDLARGISSDEPISFFLLWILEKNIGND